MNVIRTVLLVIEIIITAVVTLPYMLVALIVGLFSMKARDKMCFGAMRFEFSILKILTGARMHLTGLENVPKDEPVLYIGNHRSMFDIIMPYYLFPGYTSMISKKEWEKIPFLAWWMKLLHNFFLDRDDVKQGLKVILAAIDLVKNGYSVCIFPEGTRNKTEEDMLPFHEGSFKIAVKSGCPIIPVTMYNMDALLKHPPIVKASDIYIDFGKPIRIGELAPEEKKHIGAYTRGVMLETYNKLKEEADLK
ncbi:MAG: 1-acyl-sn-glycerol-3-phosphate acyltransferase [Lachnospiraceae bacterium]|nr:1-acyl-sn-glycerol-3-phosphate acyltransferase [Lachnospiraceae bacterium]